MPRPICIAGKNSIALAGLFYVLENYGNDSDIFALGDKQDTFVDKWQPSYLKFAKSKGIKIVELEDLYAIDDLCFISLEYFKLIKPDKFSTKSFFNIHFSLLPAYRGMYTSAHPILNGESKTGCTIHEIDAGIDTGKIISQSSFNIDERFNCKDVYENYMGKLKNRIKNNNDYPFPEKYDLIKRIDPIIKEYIFSDNFKLTGVVHGDPWFSNTMIDLKSNIKFLDMKGNIAGKLTTNGDHLTDYAKIMQSLLGFDFIVEDKQIEFTSLKKLKDFFLDAILNKGYEKELINAITICMISKTISFFPVNSHHKRSIWELATELCKDIKY